jgi:hypothetical protein
VSNATGGAAGASRRQHITPVFAQHTVAPHTHTHTHTRTHARTHLNRPHDAAAARAAAHRARRSEPRLLSGVEPGAREVHLLYELAEQQLQRALRGQQQQEEAAAAAAATAAAQAAAAAPSGPGPQHGGAAAAGGAGAVEARCAPPLLATTHLWQPPRQHARARARARTHARTHQATNQPANQQTTHTHTRARPQRRAGGAHGVDEPGPPGRDALPGPQQRQQHARLCGAVLCGAGRALVCAWRSRLAASRGGRQCVQKHMRAIAQSWCARTHTRG